MRTLSIHPFQLDLQSSVETYRPLIRTYHLSLGEEWMIEMDPIKGMQATLLKGGKSHLIRFEDIIGIDPEFRFHQANLSEYFEEA